MWTAAKAVCMGAVLYVVLFYLYARLNLRNRKKIQEKIKKSKSDILSQGCWFPVLYSSEARFQTILKLFPWENTGILFIDDAQVVFFHNSQSRKFQELRFDPKYSGVTWVGRRICTNGGLFWLAIDLYGQKHYFASETGITICDSMETTHKIYDELLRLFSSSNAYQSNQW